jgi:hypothetical protein
MITFTATDNFEATLATLYFEYNAKQAARKAEAGIRMVKEATVILEDANGIYAI